MERWLRVLFSPKVERYIGKSDSLGNPLVAGQMIHLMINTQSVEDYHGRFKFKGNGWYVFSFPAMDLNQWFFVTADKLIHWTADTMYGVTRYLTFRRWEQNGESYYAEGDIPLWDSARVITQFELDALKSKKADIDNLNAYEEQDISDQLMEAESPYDLIDIKYMSFVTDLATNPDWADFRTQIWDSEEE